MVTNSLGSVGRAAIVLACCALPARAAVLTVDVNGGAMFTSIETAIASAADGDIVVVAPGDYAGIFSSALVIDGKSLTLIPSAPGALVRHVGLTIKNVPSGGQVVVRGIDFTLLQLIALNRGLRVNNCVGNAWIEECSFYGDAGTAAFNASFPGMPGATVTNSSGCTLVRCSITGGDGYIGGPLNVPPSDGGPGMSIDAASVALLECSVTGGHAIAPLAGGGHGIKLATGTLRAGGAQITGGAAGCTSGTTIGCKAGHGLLVTGATASATLQDSTVVPGAGAVAGSAIVAPPGTVAVSATTMRSLELESPIHALQPLGVSLAGEPGDVVLIVWGVTGIYLPFNVPEGVLIAGLPLQGPFLLAQLPAGSPSLTFMVNAPPLVPASLPGFRFLVQSLVVPAGGGNPVWGSGSAFVLLQ